MQLSIMKYTVFVSHPPLIMYHELECTHNGLLMKYNAFLKSYTLSTVCKPSISPPSLS